MPPKKSLTPHQLSSGLSYVHKEAPFLAKLKGDRQEEIKKRARFQDYEDGQDDEDYDELEGAQVVMLDAKGREIHENPKAEEKAEKNSADEEEEEEDDRLPVDENGRILFRARKKKRKVDETKGEKDDNGKQMENVHNDQKPKRKKSKKALVKLSFDDNE
ncbi:hypothetical protein BX666DRAFT_998275 [Dichotomocladium elegans]|nr:hypothetical protein BX666DRAFT_998275 [Dichotomocladium elegans]